MVCLAAAGLSERGDKCVVSICTGKTETEGEIGSKAVEEKGEENKERRERGRQGKREKCGGSMSAADKGISLPPVGQRESLTMPTLAPLNTRLSLSLQWKSGTSQPLTDKTGSLNPKSRSKLSK